jgi:hypothetical protein
MRSGISRWARITAVVALTAFVPVATAGCFGSFNLTKKIYQFNKDINPDKWIQWLTFLVLSIVPIYGIGVLVDVIVANSLEFWTGENPIMAGTEPRTLSGPNGEVATFTPNSDQTIDIRIVEQNGTVHEFSLVREGATLAARDKNGALIARVTDVNGQPAVIGGAAF